MQFLEVSLSEDVQLKSGEVAQELSMNRATLSQFQSNQGWIRKLTLVYNHDLIERKATESI